MPPDDVPTPSAPSAVPAGAVEKHVESFSTPNPASTKSTETLRELARRMTSRTTDLLAIAIVVAASLTIGRQMLSWWHEDAPAVMDLGPLETLNSEWGSNGRPVSLEFGNSPFRMTRQALPSGSNPRVALNAVREHCQRILVSAASPDTPADQAELDQLQALETLTPDLEQPGNWQLYTLGGRMTAVVGAKSFPTRSEKSTPSSPPVSRRVICWGLVFPGLSHGSWTAYTFERHADNPGDSTEVHPSHFDLSQLQLPADCQRTVLMQEEGQSGLVGFQGAGQVDAWQQHFTQWLNTRGWRQAASWQSTAEGRSGRFVRREPGRHDESTLQIQFYQQSTGQGAGLVHWFPGQEPLPESPPPALRGTP